MLEIPTNELSKNSLGGTELMVNRLYSSLPEDLLKEFQIIPTRLTTELDETKIRIAWIHDLCFDPGVEYLKNGGWKKFHLLVFCSNWQMQIFINQFQIPWSKCLVIENGIEPIEDVNFEKDTDTIKLIYTPTPHRGLNVLYKAFDKLSQEYPNIELDVYSSFKLYGWDERDKEFENLFDLCRDHPYINYHGTQPNHVIRDALKTAHIFAYPSTYMETSCLCLIEAMSAGLTCVHSNLGALYETAANWTLQYQFQEDIEKHTFSFYTSLKFVIDNIKANRTPHLISQKTYIDNVHNWNIKKNHWQTVLSQMVNLPRELPKKDEHIFQYRTS